MKDEGRRMKQRGGVTAIRHLVILALSFFRHFNFVIRPSLTFFAPVSLRMMLVSPGP